MMKHILLGILDTALVIVFAIILLILFTGGIWVDVFGVTLRATRLTNPLRIAGGLYVFRAVLDRHLCRNVAIAWAYRRFRIGARLDRVVRAALLSRPYRTGLLRGFLALLGLSIIATIANPLRDTGLSGAYYDNVRCQGEPYLTTRDRYFTLWRLQVDYPEISRTYGIVWKGVMYAPKSGEYEFFTKADDSLFVYIDGRQVIDNSGTRASDEQTDRIVLEKGAHAIELRFAQWEYAANLRIEWKPPGRGWRNLAQAELYPEAPTPARRMAGKCLFILRNSAAGLLVLGIMGLGLAYRRNRPALRAYLRATRIGRMCAGVCAFFRDPAVSVPALPEPAAANRWVVPVVMIAYTLLALLWTYPLITEFSAKMVGVGGDRHIGLWNMWWLKAAFVDWKVSPLFTDYVFFPQGVSLAFHDMGWYNALLSIPLQQFFTRPEIYNLLFWQTFVVGGLGTFLLVIDLVGDRRAAFLAGVVFVFWGGRSYFVDHLSLASIQWIPFCALYLNRILRERTFRNVVWLGLVIALNALCAWYYAMYMVIYIALWLGYTAWTDRPRVLERGFLLRLTSAGALSVILLAPLLIPMLREMSVQGDYMVSVVLDYLSTSVNGLLLPNVTHAIWGKALKAFYLQRGLPIEEWEFTGGVFIGYTILALCLYAILKLKRAKAGFWTFSGAIFLILSMGPHPLWMLTHNTKIDLPYALFPHLPMLNMIRVPIRFMILVMLCASVLTGYACWHWFRRIRFKNTLFVALLALILVEHVRGYYVTALPETPDFFTTLGQDPDVYPILELTQLMHWSHASTRSSYFQTIHRKKAFHAHASRVSLDTHAQAYALYPLFDDLFAWPESRDDPVPGPEATVGRDRRIFLELLSFYNVRYVVLADDYEHGNFDRNRERLRPILGEPLETQYGYALFAVPQNVPASENRVFPGFGLSPVEFDDAGVPYRKANRIADLHLLNVAGSRTARLTFQLKSLFRPHESVDIRINATVLKTIEFDDAWSDIITLENIPLEAGLNSIHFRMPRTQTINWEEGYRIRGLRLEW